jgi:hypothetical protein
LRWRSRDGGGDKLPGRTLEFPVTRDEYSTLRVFGAPVVELPTKFGLKILRAIRCQE